MFTFLVDLTLRFPEDVNLDEIEKILGLFETMGSDFHGPKAKPNAILGQTEKII